MREFISYIHKGKKYIYKYLIFRFDMTHLHHFSKKSGKTFKLQKQQLITEMNNDEINADNWRDKKNEWVDYVKNDVLCTTLSYARYSKPMEEMTGFGMKDCLSLPGLGWKYFNSLKTEDDESIYTYIDKYMRWFVRQSVK